MVLERRIAGVEIGVGDQGSESHRVCANEEGGIMRDCGLLLKISCGCRWPWLRQSDSS
jgi:hypothetical protein